MRKNSNVRSAARLLIYFIHCSRSEITNLKNAKDVAHENGPGSYLLQSLFFHFLRDPMVVPCCAA